MSRFFYLDDRPDAPPCDRNLLHARQELRERLEQMFVGQAADVDALVRLMDRLIQAHVADYAYKHPQSYGDDR